MTVRGNSRPTVVLLATTDPVDQAVLESDLLRAGYHVFVADTVEAAVELVSTNPIQALVTDLGLAGGGGFSLCRRLAPDGEPRLPAVALSRRPVDPDVRKIGAECGIETFLEPPHSVGQLRAAIEQALARARRKTGWEEAYSFTGDLSSWSVADLIRYMEYYGWTGTVSTRSRGGSGTLHFKDGTLTSCAQGDVQGERALGDMLTWEEGHFTLDHEPAGEHPKGARPARNIHRSTRDVLEEYLDQTADAQQRMAQLPGANVPHRFDRAALAPDQAVDAGLLARLERAMTGSLTLAEALHDARVCDRPTLAVVERLLSSGAIRPVTSGHGGAAAPPAFSAPPPPSDFDIVPASADEIERSGRTVRRKLQLGRASADAGGDRFADVLPEEVSRKQRKQRLLFTYLALGLAVLAVVIFLLARGGGSDRVDTRMIEDGPTQSQPAQDPAPPEQPAAEPALGE